jgi:indolepyruvate ferredoxin oxidoreductase alpha subunit
MRTEKRLPAFAESAAELFLTGNEAIARGAVEAGVNVVTGHPGAPVTDIVTNLARVSDNLGISVSWCPNENTAFEEALGASLAGLRSMVVFKDVGLNACLDRFMAASRAGIRGGLVVVVGDGMNATPDRQESRPFFAMAQLVTFDPSNPDEARRMVGKAFEISTRLELPAVIRVYDRVCNMRALIKPKEIGPSIRTPRFDRTLSSKYISWGQTSKERFAVLKSKQDEMQKLTQEAGFDRLEMRGELGVVASGFCYPMVQDALDVLDCPDRFSLLKIGTIHPLPINMIERFLTTTSRVLVVEDMDPYVEGCILRLVRKLDRKVEISGKLSGDIQEIGEISIDDITNALAKLGGLKLPHRPSQKEALLLDRGVQMCPGCLYWGSLYALRKAVKEFSAGKYVGVSDSACAICTTLRPYKVFDAMYHFGSSIGVASGLARSGLREPVVAVLGDGAFYHSAMMGLLDAVWNNAKMTVLLLDNMGEYAPGGLPDPGSGRNADGKPARIVKVEDVAKGMGVEFVKVIDGEDISATIEVLKAALGSKGLAVVVARGHCATEAQRILEERGVVRKPAKLDENLCIYPTCTECLDLACPSIILGPHKPYIDETCIGCSLCTQVCPPHAISSPRRGL